MLYLITSFYYMSLCVYHEAQGEPARGQRMVVNSILNRAQERGLTVKKVIYQSAQYSWTEDNRSDAVTDHKVFITCMKSVVEALVLRLSGKTGGGVNLYHTKDVHPWWADRKRVTYLYTVGNHLCYHERRN